MTNSSLACGMDIITNNNQTEPVMKSVKDYLSLAIIISLMLGSLSVSAAEPKKIKKYTAEITPDGIQKVMVVGGGYYFDPNYIIVKVNVPVELTVTKEPGIIPHNIVIKSPETGIEFDQGLSINPKTITFTPTKAGNFPIYCSKKLLFLKSHRDKGMEGTLEVRE